MSCEHEEVIRTDKGYECGTCCQPMTVKPAAQEAGNDQEVPQRRLEDDGPFGKYRDYAEPHPVSAEPQRPETPPKVPQRYALDHKVLSEPPVASESWEWDKQRHIAMGQFAKRLIEELGTAEAENARLEKSHKELMKLLCAYPVLPMFCSHNKETGYCGGCKHQHEISIDVWKKDVEAALA